MLHLTSLTESFEDYSHVFLLTDFVIFSYHIPEPDDETAYRFIYMRHAGLASANITNRNPASLSFEIQFKTSYFVLSLENANEKTQWLESLAAAKRKFGN